MIVSPSEVDDSPIQIGAPKSEGKQLQAAPTHPAGESSMKFSTNTGEGGPLIAFEQEFDGDTSLPKV
jgi:hypothetical protein